MKVRNLIVKMDHIEYRNALAWVAERVAQDRAKAPNNGKLPANHPGVVLYDRLSAIRDGGSDEGIPVNDTTFEPPADDPVTGTPPLPDPPADTTPAPIAEGLDVPGAKAKTK